MSFEALTSEADRAIIEFINRRQVDSPRPAASRNRGARRGPRRRRAAVTETQLNGSPPPSTDSAPAAGRTNVAARTAIWTGVALGAAATATVAFFVVRAMWQKRAPDETSERIQSLIDEANRLIRTLEEKK